MMLVNNDMEEWVDVLSARRHSSDLLWITLHDWKCWQYKHCRGRTPEMIRNDVYNQPYIKALISENEDLKPRIERVLTEMSHTFSLRSIRFIGYFLTKIMKSIYRNVWVSKRLPISKHFIYHTNQFNVNLSEAINSLAKEAPILYMPTHRSYADFLLMSYVCFHFNLPLPSIAAGIDFLALNQIASLLRASGAFYIRRSFKHLNDNLYWHVFRAYVQSQILGGERPIEFFIEGTRSRSGKSLYPRSGLLSVALELYFSGQISDLIIIPVSISYDRVLEESLYAKELWPTTNIGGKPPETTSHLVKGANAILSQNFGSVYIRFNEPFSLRQLSSKRDYRLLHTLQSKYDSNFIQTQEENDFICYFCKQIINRQQMNLVLSPFTLASLSILTYNDIQEENISIKMNSLKEDVLSLKSMLPYSNFSGNYHNESIDEQLIDALLVHSNIVELCENKSLVIIRNDPIVRIQFQQYANQAMQLLIDFACFIYTSGNFSQFKRLKWILSREFIYNELSINETFLSAQYLSHVFSNERIQKILLFQINYYIMSYLSIINWLLTHFSSQTKAMDLKSLVKIIHQDITLCSDLTQNALQIMININAIVRDSNNYLSLNISNLNKLYLDLNELSSIERDFSFTSDNLKFKSNL